MIKLFSGQELPLEMHKVRIVQKLNLPNIDERQKAITDAGNNTFLLKNKDVFLDMLTDSGSNAMSDRQQSAMFIADDSYAGSETFYRLENALQKFFGMKYFLPTHQGRACENIISETFVKDGDFVPMNYHFTTTRAHIAKRGGTVLELFKDSSLEIKSDDLFKGNMDLDKLEKLAAEKADKIAFVRMEAGTNLIGGQPFSLQNLKDVKKICEKYNLMLVLDASLLADNLYFIKTREEACKNMELNEIVLKMAELCDIIYFSARKLGCARGGGICSNNEDLIERMKEFIPLFEGFLTYGGMSVREMEAIAVGLEETLDFDMISQGPMFIKYMADRLIERNIPVITPAGGLGCHLDAMSFCSHIPQNEYPAGALAAALYITGGIRGMERGTLSEERDENGIETLSSMELLRLALPRRVFTLSQVMFAVDRIDWLFQNRELIGGLKFTKEPKILRFFFGMLEPTSDWQSKLVNKFKADFGDSL